jgi:DNA-binding transcriptional LysR family regulator
MRIDYLGLQAFLAIAERGSFHRAAMHLNLSQTALSHRLRKLEESLGVELLSRTTRQVTLTSAGLDLLPRASRALDDLSRAVAEVAARGGNGREKVTIGCLPTIAQLVALRVLPAFRAAHPEALVRIHDNSAAEIAAKVKSGDASFGLTILTANRWDLDARPLLSEAFVLVVHDGHRFAGRDSISWEEAVGEPLVRISAETANRILIDDALGERRERLDWRYEVQRVPTALAIAASGVALTIVPTNAFAAGQVAGIRAVPLVSPAIMRTVSVVTPRGQPLGRLAAALLELIETHLAG